MNASGWERGGAVNEEGAEGSGCEMLSQGTERAGAPKAPCQARARTLTQAQSNPRAAITQGAVSSMRTSVRRQSVAISGNQWQSPRCPRCNQKQSEAISPHLGAVARPRSNQKQSEAIRSNQKQSEAVRSNQKQSEATRSNILRTAVLWRAHEATAVASRFSCTTPPSHPKKPLQSAASVRSAIRRRCVPRRRACRSSVRMQRR